MTRDTARDDAEREPRRTIAQGVRTTASGYHSAFWSGDADWREGGVGDVQVPPPNGHEPIADLVPVIRRVVAARIRNPAQIDDIVQETLSRVMAARSRVERDTLAPYAVATARNLIASAVPA